MIHSRTALVTAALLLLSSSAWSQSVTEENGYIPFFVSDRDFVEEDDETEEDPGTASIRWTDESETPDPTTTAGTPAVEVTKETLAGPERRRAQPLASHPAPERPASRRDTPMAAPPPASQPAAATEQPALLREPPRTGHDNRIGYYSSLADDSHCPRQGEHHLGRSLLLTAFPRHELQSATGGGLHQVDQQMPLLLREHLAELGGYSSLAVLPRGLDTGDDASQQARQTRLLAEQHRAQYLVSGRILDMSMSRPGSNYSPGLLERGSNAAHDLTRLKTPLDRRDRRFAFELSLWDGITGQLLQRRQYETSGIWNLSQRRGPGFASARFWRTDYGRQVHSLLAQAATDLDTTVNCLPYMARVDAHSGGDRVTLHSGAASGLKPGDALPLYQLLIQPVTGRFGENDVRMINTGTLLQVTEVYPGHATARVNGQQPLYGRYTALVPVLGGH